MVNQGLRANLPGPGLGANLSPEMQDKFLPIILAAAAPAASGLSTAGLISAGAAAGATGIAGLNFLGARKDKKKAKKEAKKARRREDGSRIGDSISDLIEKLTIERAQSQRRLKLLSAFMAATGGQRFGFPGAPNRGGA